MKRNFLALALLAAFVPAGSLRAQQDSPTAAAEREQAEERHRTLTKRLDGIEESIAAFQKNATSLRDEVRRLKDELDRVKSKNDSSVTQESIKHLGEKIGEVDRKRLADGELVAKQFDELKKFILEPRAGGPRIGPVPATGGNSSRTNAGRSPSPPVPVGKQSGWDYTIRSGDTLDGIVLAVRKQGIAVSKKQIEQANEGVNWNRLQIGKVIFIPKP